MSDHDERDAADGTDSIASRICYAFLADGQFVPDQNRIPDGCFVSQSENTRHAVKNPGEATR